MQNKENRFEWKRKRVELLRVSYVSIATHVFFKTCMFMVCAKDADTITEVENIAYF